MNRNNRIVEILGVNGRWYISNGMDVKKGNVFRMFEPDGTPVEIDGVQVFLAESDAYENKDGIGTVNIYDMDNKNDDE